MMTSLQPPMSDTRDEFDSPWKDILETYFLDFMLFFFPQIYTEIAWERGYEFLETELQQIVRDAEIGKRWADKLVKVWHNDGQEAWVICHLEVQSQVESVFPKRMFTYNYRLRDRYNAPIVSLAVLGDERMSWRPQQFQEQIWGCSVTFEFPMVKLLDYESRWDELMVRPNPFATVVMTHLKAKETRLNPEQRQVWKFTLTRRLYELGYERQDVLNLYRFIDWLLELPDGLEQLFQQDLQRFEQERQMPYITTIERRAKQEGLKEGERSLILKQLSRRIGVISPVTQAQIEALSLEKLESLGEALLDFTSLQDLVHWLGS